MNRPVRPSKWLSAEEYDKIFGKNKAEILKSLKDSDETALFPTHANKCELAHRVATGNVKIQKKAYKYSWIEALRIYNQEHPDDRGTAKKGSDKYNAIKKIMQETNENELKKDVKKLSKQIKEAKQSELDEAAEKSGKLKEVRDEVKELKGDTWDADIKINTFVEREKMFEKTIKELHNEIAKLKKENEELKRG